MKVATYRIVSSTPESDAASRKQEEIEKVRSKLDETKNGISNLKS